jgi:ethanolamine phosphate phosphodiesterase
VADPQLVDPHTYPDRPWPLSSLTIVYTDLYLRRSYRYLQQQLVPDSTLFLGDLFDGGREWATADSKSPEKRYRKYGTDFWKREYKRFAHLFLRGWRNGLDDSESTSAPMGRRLIAAVAGNHDLGFASGIQKAVKDRFDAHFGPLNRVDVLGNHSVVSLDTVSLSAMDQVDPKTGSSGAGDGSALATANSHLWKPVEDFLNNAKAIRQKAVLKDYRQQMNLPITPNTARGLSPFVPETRDALEAHPIKPSPEPLLSISSSQYPTIVLSHVPLYRPADTPCGPLREGRPSISLTAGYQYQNVLTPLISQDIIKHLVPEEIAIIYSGDDHDYCEIEHNEFTGRTKEITVKSMSWAMGVRHPGVQLVSLWNPIDLASLTTNPDLPTPKDTVQNHLCLLPDQLTIFIRYGQLLLLTLIILAINALRRRPQSPEKSHPLLPIHDKPHEAHPSISSSSDHTHQLKTRGKLSAYGNLPASSRSSSPHPFAPRQGGYLVDSANGHAHTHEYSQSRGRGRKDSDDWGMPSTFSMGKSKTKLQVFGRSMRDIAVPVLGWYFWLMWRDR